jgi:hypothetical protein
MPATTAHNQDRPIDFANSKLEAVVRNRTRCAVLIATLLIAKVGKVVMCSGMAGAGNGDGELLFIPPSRRTGGPRRSMSSGDVLEQVTKCKKLSKEVLAFSRRNNT